MSEIAAVPAAQDAWLQKPQRRLGRAGLLALLVCTSLAMPLSLDMYTPAVPHMVEHLATTEGMVNLTLVGYYLFFAVGLLVFGPMSDRIGRRPVLLAGLGIYAVASALCALAPTIEVLIAARVLQALGAGAADSMTNSVVKDAFREEKRQVALSFIQLMFILGPVIAPVLGAFVVSALSWRATFWVLAAVGIACFGLSLLFEETFAPEERASGRANTAGQFAEVLRDRGFSAFLAVFCLFNLGFMAYVAVASYIYVNFFGLSEMGYGLFFAATALFTTLGPFAWELFSRWMSARRFLELLVGVGFVSGACMLVIGQAGPVAFCVPMLVFAVCEAASRPLSVNILLSQHEEGTGASSSVINFVNTVAGALGMLVVHVPAPNYVVALGSTIAGCMGLALVGWFLLLRSGIAVKGVTE